MFHYLYTNDMRISNLENSLVEAARCFRDNCVPSAFEDKSKNNNMSTLGFYFNLTSDSNCTKLAAAGNARKVVLNFIKKFQFPNPRTHASLSKSVSDGICLAPLRMILKILYVMTLSCDDAYLSSYEVYKYIFINDKIAKNKDPNILEVIDDITKNRGTNVNETIPDDEILNNQGIYWNHCKRQLSEMINILLWSGCVTKDSNGLIRIDDNNLTRDNKADIFEIVNCSDYWEPEKNLDNSENLNSYQEYMDINDSECDDIRKDSESVNISAVFESHFPRNRVIFGAPGTGKSFTLNQQKNELIGENNESDYERVTFHPDYSYANFVGTYKPVPYKDGDGNDLITYQYVPGPFMRIYVKALDNKINGSVRPFLLLIEEINRANVAAVFGDIFQLLDRDDSGASEYPVQASEDIRTYLAKELGGDPSKYEKIQIPENLFIWASMNSADQGVFPMDTAFKRRWDFTYIGIDDNDEEIRGKTFILGTEERQRVEWNKLRKAINKFLADKGINEDKQLGPYFIAKNIIEVPDENENKNENFIEAFKNKVIMYLFEDAAKHKRSSLFEGCHDRCSRYSEICKEFDKKGVNIFNSDIQNNADTQKVTDNGMNVAQEDKESE